MVPLAGLMLPGPERLQVIVLVDSVRVAVKVFAAPPATTVAVVGSMVRLGAGLLGQPNETSARRASATLDFVSTLLPPAEEPSKHATGFAPEPPCVQRGATFTRSLEQGNVGHKEPFRRFIRCGSRRRISDATLLRADVRGRVLQ